MNPFLEKIKSLLKFMLYMYKSREKKIINMNNLVLPPGAYVALHMRDYSHYEMRENKRHLSCGFP